MSSESREQRTQAAVARLNDREAFAYRTWCGMPGRRAVAPDLNARLFQLYLVGHTCEEIRQLNPALALGDIVAAKVEGEWDVLRDEHRAKLLQSTADRLQQSTLQTVNLLCDVMAVAARQQGEKLQRYLMTGNEAELQGAMCVQDFGDLKKVVETLQKISGTEAPVVINPSLDTAQPLIPDATKPIDPSQAADLLRGMVSRSKTTKEN